MTEGPSHTIGIRPQRAATGRPPKHSRAEITTAAIAIADREGLDAVSMRRVAAELRTGAASLYRYIDSREDLLDLMIDATGAEYAYAAATGDWLNDLLGLGEQARTIMRHHTWLPPLLLARPVLGPNGLFMLEHVPEALAHHPASTAAKLEAFGIFNATTALFVHNELTGGAARQQRNAAYLHHATGHRPPPPARRTPGADSANRSRRRSRPSGSLPRHPGQNPRRAPLPETAPCLNERRRLGSVDGLGAADGWVDSDLVFGDHQAYAASAPQPAT